MPKIKASTLILWGELDDSTPLEDAKLMETLIPDAGLVVFEGAGHFSYLEQPDRTLTILKSFIGG
jgi:pimeloyl-ACP methyl ester carboxylesterase